MDEYKLTEMGIVGIVRDICTYKKRMENKEYAAMAANFAFKSSK